MSSLKESLGWTCTQCTFQHHAPAERCAMCNHLRVTPKHMYDFVNGIPIPKECQTDPLFSRAPGVKANNDVENRPPTLSQRSKVISNPYFTKTKTTQSIASNPSKTEQLRIDQVLQAKNPPSVFQAAASTTTNTPRPVEQRQLSSKNGQICPIFQPRTNVVRPSHPQRQQLPFTPGPVPLDLTFSKEWIFPVDDDFPKRDYQLEISEAAIHEDTLVSLPTGLGKTLIAAVVMYNYYRFFPQGKILFLAPTLPLVNQQVQACFNIMGIPETDTAVLTGKINASRRAQLWNEKRVFYCTPQTIQFDLEASRCNPDYFVCVVLDEAHRATGNHSYVTIVNKLFESNAKFRLLGLSATPGKTIKDIQAVIDVLRVSKIEARTEDDASISRYIHDRAVEEVMVPNVSVAKDVERMLNDLLLVQLDKLRTRGALSGTMDYQSITSHQLRKFQERLPDNSLSGIFHIATTLCDLRTKVHVNGLACVHSVMKRLLSTRHMGPMASFLKSEEFLKVWDVVENGKDAAANNPKLMKLKEILTEHFERDRAIGRSSRSIVFSQFRDSVSEIVSTLQTCSPLIRPRHFIGQGNRTKGSEGQLQGMNQAEQQEVIRQFRSDVYNVLVCTSIGEEGLDIGEVDLIVNYDVVRSAIRSIQRIGRTGRKRDGRVVVLVSEGQEKKSYDSSKHSVGTLARALKSNKFKVNLGEPLFPTRPVVRERMMAVADSFRSSQVEGHEGAKKRGRETSCLDDKTENVETSEWRLSTSQKAYASSITSVFTLSDCLTYENIPRDLSRRFLTARRLSFARNNKRTNAKGRTSLMLHRIESSHSCTDGIGGQKSRSLPSRLPSDFKYKSFPLKLLEVEAHVNFGMPLNTVNTVQDAEAPAATTIKPKEYEPEEVEAHVDFDKPLITVNSVQEAETTTTTTITSKESEPNEARPPSSNSTKRSKRSPDNPYQGVSEVKASSKSAPLNSSLPDSTKKHDMPERAPPSPLKRNPYASIAKVSLHDSNHAVNVTDDNVIQSTCASGPSSVANQIENFAPVTKMCTSMQTTSSKINLERGPSRTSPAIETFLQTRGTGKMEMEKPQDSAIERNAIGQTGNKCSSRQTLVGCRATQNHLQQAAEPAKVQVQSHTHVEDISELEDEFVLPSQSDCSTSSNEDDDHGDAIGDTTKSPVPSTPVHSAEETEFRLPSPASSCSASSSDETVPTRKRPSNPNTQTQHFDPALQSNDLFVVDGCLQSSNSPEDEEIIFRRGNRVAKRRAIVDATQCADDTPIQAHSPQEPLNDTQPLRDLTNTQETRTPSTEPSTDEIVCAICFSGDSPDEDPIVLCDGRGQGKACNVAVHTTCYSIPATFRDEDEWRCDPCDFRHKGLNKQPITCLSCGRSDGALRRVDGNIFHHIQCTLPEPSRGSRCKDDEKKADSFRQSNLHRRRAVRKFFDDEAGIDSDEDMDGDLSEEELLRALEEEEADISGFINDTSQLGYTQDELDRLDLDANVTVLHQELDNMRTRAQQFKTPILNRRMRDAKGRESLGSADSAKGLGNMHFIRSVLEHHRQGGDAHEIEEHYHQLEAEASSPEEDISQNAESTSKKIIYYDPSDSDEE